jgi:hypothetical protein
MLVSCDYVTKYICDFEMRPLLIPVFQIGQKPKTQNTARNNYLCFILWSTYLLPSDAVEASYLAGLSKNAALESLAYQQH